MKAKIPVSKANPKKPITKSHRLLIAWLLEVELAILGARELLDAEDPCAAFLEIRRAVEGLVRESVSSFLLDISATFGVLEISNDAAPQTKPWFIPSFFLGLFLSVSQHMAAASDEKNRRDGAVYSLGLSNSAEAEAETEAEAEP